MTATRPQHAPAPRRTAMALVNGWTQPPARFCSAMAEADTSRLPFRSPVMGRGDRPRERGEPSPRVSMAATAGEDCPQAAPAWLRQSSTSSGCWGPLLPSRASAAAAVRDTLQRVVWFHYTHRSNSLRRDAEDRREQKEAGKTPPRPMLHDSEEEVVSEDGSSPRSWSDRSVLLGR